MTQNLLVAKGGVLFIFPKMTNRYGLINRENYSNKCSTKRQKTNSHSTYARHIGILPQEVKLKPIYER